MSILIISLILIISPASFYLLVILFVLDFLIFCYVLFFLLFSIFIHLFSYLSIHLSIIFFIFKPICPSIHLAVYLLVYFQHIDDLYSATLKPIGSLKSRKLKRNFHMMIFAEFNTINQFLILLGVLKLWSGFPPYYLRCGGHTVLMFMSVEWLRKMYTIWRLLLLQFEELKATSTSTDYW